MKRSQTIVLTLMGASFFALQATRREPAVAFADISQCANVGNEIAACRRAYDDALAVHQAKAPRFSSRLECQAVTDTPCANLTLKGATALDALSYAPIMSGFQLRRDDDCRNQDPNRTDCRRSGGGGGGYSGGGGGWARRGDPLYESRTEPGSYRDVDSVRSGSSAGPRSAPTIRTATVSRGGFGSFRGFLRGG